MKMQTGDIIFIRGKTPISSLIRFVDKGEFTHAAVAVSPTHVLEAKWNKRVNIVPFYYDDFEIVEMHFSDKEKQMLEDYIPDLAGKWYDYSHALYLFLSALLNWEESNRWDRPDQLICSDLVALVLNELKMIPEDRVRGLKPNPLYLIVKKISEQRKQKENMV